MFVNIDSAVPSARFSAVLVEGPRALGLESTLRDQGCAVRRVATLDAANEALETADILVISAAGFSDVDVLGLVEQASPDATIFVATESTDLAVKAARLGASTALGGSLDFASAQLGQVLGIVDFKRRVGRPSSVPPPSSHGIVQRRSTPLPKEATPEALDALVAAAEALVPMHKFQRVYVDYALRRFGGNKVHTAAALGIDRRTIQRWARARADQSPMSEDVISS
jgi:DNA-binding NtrC family response regulator